MDKKTTAHHQNCRRSVRHSTRRSTKVRCHGGKLGLGPNIATEILDISETGARLRVREQCRKGDEIEVQFTSISHRKPIRIKADVVWCVASNDGDFCVGVQFRATLAFRDVQLL